MLWLGVRLERHLGNRDAEASQGMALKKLFPDSQEKEGISKLAKK